LKRKAYTPEERVEKVLRGGRADVVPFTVYKGMIPQGEAERRLRNRGLCIVEGAGVFRTHRPNVKVTSETFREGQDEFTRTFFKTPAGVLTTLRKAAGFTSWVREKMFKTPDDYKAILSLIEDERYEPTYDHFARVKAEWGGDAILRAGIGIEPMQQLISTDVMAMEDWCREWMDNRDEVLKLYEAVVRNRRRIYPIVAAGPASHANYGGNVVPQIIGREVFEKYYVPHYNEAAEVLHGRGKLIGSHFDADCRLLADLVAAADLDYVEAFTPAPDTDMTLAEARAAWPEKVLWLNFPSSIHLKPDAEVERAAASLVSEIDSVDGVIMGITEDMPADRRLDSCRSIMDGLERHARQNPSLYERPGPLS